MKQEILKKGSPFHLGGKPKQRAQYDLFSLKSLMRLREKEKTGTVLTVVDVQKFFDKEPMLNVLNSLHRPKVDHC